MGKLSVEELNLDCNDYYSMNIICIQYLFIPNRFFLLQKCFQNAWLLDIIIITLFILSIDHMTTGQVLYIYTVYGCVAGVAYGNS